MKRPQIRPLVQRRTFRLALLGTWLWCLHAVAHADTADLIADAGAQHFVPRITPVECDGTIQMIRAAELKGNDIHIRQIARWSDADSAGFASIADLVIEHFDESSTRRIGLEQLRTTLASAGVNISKIRFAGTTSCLVTRDETQPPAEKQPANDQEYVQQWIDKPGNGTQTPRAAATSEPTAPKSPAIDPTTDSTYRTLRATLLADLATRLNLPPEELMVTFDPKDRTYLKLSEPMFQFNLEPRRITDLGKVTWDLTISNGKKEQKLALSADARLWEKQLIAAKSISYHQVLRDEDLTERRVLVDHLNSDPLLTRSLLTGQQAARDIQAGMVLTTRMMDPIPLVKFGEPVTITLKSGNVTIRTVATAMESGSYGQSIKVRSEENQNIMVVTMTGPQEAAMGPTAHESVASLEK